MTIIAGSHFGIQLIVMNSIGFSLAFVLFTFYPYLKKERTEAKKKDYLTLVKLLATLGIVAIQILTSLCPSLIEIVIPFALSVCYLVACGIEKSNNKLIYSLSILWGLVLLAYTTAMLIEYI